MRIAIFYDSPSVLYLQQLEGMKKGFLASGLSVYTGTQHLDEAAMLPFISEYKPDVIMEVNRSRAQAPFIPKNIFHVCWIQDPVAGKPLNVFSGSDLIYCFTQEWVNALQGGSECPVKLLVPGFDQAKYYYRRKPYLSDGSFAGHMPPRWKDSMLHAVIGENGNRKLTFGRLYKIYEREIVKKPPEKYENGYPEILYEAIEKIFGLPAKLDESILGILCLTGYRMATRGDFIRMILKTSTSFRIAGEDYWNQWEEFNPYYIGKISEPEDLSDFYSSSRINFHQGESNVHFRTVDCLGAGGLLFVLRLSTDSMEGGINTFYDEGRHFISFAPEELSDLAKYYLTHENESRRIGKAAAEFSSKNYTWHHRASKIVADLNLYR